MSNKNMTDELNNVSGGKADNFGEIYCVKCSKSFYADDVPSKTVGSGCNKHKEYQCPLCGKWIEE